jgi:undecaprenyl-diphosphatase
MQTSTPSPRPAWVAAAAAIWILAALVGGNRFEVDVALHTAFGLAEQPALATLARIVTNIGGWQVLTLITLAACAALAIQQRARAILPLLAIIYLGRIAVEAQKMLFARDRPDLLDRLVEVTSLSYPSGHAANSAITFLALALAFGGGRALLLLALTSTFLIGLSRIALGVHWPSDVVGGWAFAALWLLVWRNLGNARRLSVIDPLKESNMTDQNSSGQDQRGNDRADSAKRHDDSEIIDAMEEGPSFSGASGGNLQRDIASRAEQQHDVGGKPGVTRVQDKDKPEQANLPRFNDS